MEPNAYIVELTASLLYLVLGVRLVRVAALSGRLPELTTGTYCALLAVAYLLYEAPLVFRLFAPLFDPFYLAARIVLATAVLVLAVAARRWFRRDEPWAAWLVLGIAVALTAGIAGSVLEGDPAGTSLLGSRGFWLEWTGQVAVFVWVGIESFSQYDRARQRLQLGDGDPVVCNRYLLFTGFAITQVCANLMLLSVYAHLKTAGFLPMALDVLLGSLELSSIAVLWLTFFPPASYRGWIIRRAASASLGPVA